jgi:hypothetical protein
MARQHHDREDLLRDATAFVERFQARISGQSEEWFIGFRPDSALGIYAGQHRVLQFDRHGRLRRVFWDGRMFQAVRGELVRLDRRREDTRLRLDRRPLSSEESAELLRAASQVLNTLCASLRDETLAVTGQVVMANQDVVKRMRDWLENQPPSIVVAYD